MRSSIVATWIVTALCGAGIFFTAPSSLASGFGEQRPVQFQSANEQQVRHNMERDRNNLNANGGCCAGGTAGAGARGHGQAADASVNQVNVTQNINVNVDGDNNNINDLKGILNPELKTDQNASGILQDNTNSIDSTSSENQSQY